MLTESQRVRILAGIRFLHTLIWAIFVGCIAAIPAAASARNFRLAAMLSALVWIECAVLALNQGRCPLTNLAEKYTADQKPNSDIYLPDWLARWNKEIFGALFGAGEVFALVMWLRSR
jgi:hypothetical protein